jgi:hypothetical protein
MQRKVCFREVKLKDLMSTNHEDEMMRSCERRRAKDYFVESVLCVDSLPSYDMRPAPARTGFSASLTMPQQTYDTIQ